MGIIRKFAVQGHAVPKGYQSPRGPFPPELFQAPEKAPEENNSDSLHEALDDIKMYFCKYCGDIVYSDGLASHVCVDENFE
jgi:hypothetical protein